MSYSAVTISRSLSRNLLPGSCFLHGILSESLGRARQECPVTVSSAQLDVDVRVYFPGLLFPLTVFLQFPLARISASLRRVRLSYGHDWLRGGSVHIQVRQSVDRPVERKLLRSIFRIFAAFNPPSILVRTHLTYSAIGSTEVRISRPTM